MRTNESAIVRFEFQRTPTSGRSRRCGCSSINVPWASQEIRVFARVPRPIADVSAWLEPSWHLLPASARPVRELGDTPDQSPCFHLRSFEPLIPISSAPDKGSRDLMGHQHSLGAFRSMTGSNCDRASGSRSPGSWSSQRLPPPRPPLSLWRPPPWLASPPFLAISRCFSLLIAAKPRFEPLPLFGMLSSLPKLPSRKTF